MQFTPRQLPGGVFVTVTRNLPKIPPEVSRYHGPATSTLTSAGPWFDHLKLLS